MSEWWYAEKGNRVGPIDTEELFTRYKTRHIDLDTVVWKKGMNEWHPLARVPELKDIKLVTREPLDEEQDGASAPAERNADPKRRCGARVLDALVETGLVALPLIIGLQFLSAEAMQFLPHPVTAYILALLCLPLALVLDAMIYGIAGNTLGKVLLGVKALRRDDSTIGFTEYLKRNFSLWRQALFYGIFPINIFSMLRQYRRLASGQHASYDAPSHFRVRLTRS